MNERIDGHTEVFTAIGKDMNGFSCDNAGKTNPRESIKAYFRKYLTKYFPLLESAESMENFGAELLHYAKRLIAGIVTLFFTALFAESAGAMESHPLGLGFLCAQSGYAPFAFLGMLIARIISPRGEASYAFSAVIGYGFMILLNSRRLRSAERNSAAKSIVTVITPIGLPLHKRVLCAALAAFADGMIRIIGDGFLYYDLFGGIFGLAVAPFVTFALTPLFERNIPDTDAVTENRLIKSRLRTAELAFGFVFIYSLRSVTVFTFSPSAVLALIFTFYAAAHGGGASGAVTGLIMGLAYDIDFLQCFALSGLVFGIFIPAGILPSAASAGAVAAALSIRLGGFDAMRTLMPDIVAGLTLYIPLEKSGFLNRLYSVVSARRDKASENKEECDTGIGNPAAIAEANLSERKSEIETLSRALDSLADIFDNMSERVRTPSGSEIRRLTVDCLDEACRECKNKEMCWSEKYKETSSVAEKIVKGLKADGEYSEELLPEEFLKRCENAVSIVGKINSAYSSRCEDIIKRDRTDVFALDYRLISKLLRENEKKNEFEYQLDREKSELLRRAVAETDFRPNNISVYGRRRLRVIAGGIALGQVGMSIEEIRRICESVCNTPFAEPELRIKDGYVTLTATALPRFSAEFSSRSLEKENERVCGDTVTQFENPRGYSYSLISDGMGSGADAAISSRTVTVFLKRMLGGALNGAPADGAANEAGANDAACSLEMLGAFLRGRASECFSTVDLLEIDRYTGIACFIKCGAAPSYVLRDGNLFKVSSVSMPIGITKELNAEAVRFELKSGDIIIMISDGIAETLEDSAWLAELVVSIYEDNGDAGAGAYSDAILEGADNRRGRRDDMSVGVVKIGCEAQRKNHPCIA